jgi:hypothetical protein
MSEYDPAPPFHAGSLRTAPPEVREPMEKMLVGFRQQALSLARQST